MGGEGDEMGREGAHLNVCLCVRAIMLPLGNQDVCASLAGNVPPDECGEPQRGHILRTLHQ